MAGLASQSRSIAQQLRSAVREPLLQVAAAADPVSAAAEVRRTQLFREVPKRAVPEIGYARRLEETSTRLSEGLAAEGAPVFHFRLGDESQLG